MSNAYDYYLAQFVDIHGRPKAKLVPAAHGETLFTTGAGFAGFAVSGLGMGPHDQEFMAVGDRGAVRRVSWMPGVANVTSEGHVSGKPWPLDSRVIAREAIAAFKRETGLEFYTGLEPEFFLFTLDDQGKLEIATKTNVLEKPCYDFRNLSSVSDYLMDLRSALDVAGIDVYQIDHEDANGQFEVNFTYSDALTSADRLTFFKMAAGGIARAHKMVCSFMPKPFADRSGSGLHVHMSAGSNKGNAFEDVNDTKGLALSALAYKFLGGLIAHAEGLTAIAAPSVNSYKRLVSRGSRSGATWAPVNVAYGDNNRTAFVRVPRGRLELRVSDAAANPYLLTAAVIYAGLDGVRSRTDPGLPCSENLYGLDSTALARFGIRRLPISLRQALDALQSDSVLCEGLGASFIREFTNVKEQEIDELQLIISPQEFARYVEFY